MPKVTTVIVRGAIVQDQRERRGLSRAELGKMIGRSHESIRRIELGLPVGRLLVCQVANVLEGDVDEWVLPDAA